MNEQKICFIMCSNNSFLAEECIRYINNLTVPDGMSVEVQVITGAPSMTSGYNEAMMKTDAKYKVYLHQDVLIVHKNFLVDTIKLFKAHSEVGMLGMVGNVSLADDGCPWSDGMHRRIGRIYCDLIYDSMDSIFANVQDEYAKVLVIDGLLMMTQYDVRWRDDLFGGWDFYDCSQSMEFWKEGYEVIVPKMEQSWCLHDNDIMHLQDYEKWRKIFYREYASIYQGCTGDSIEQKIKLIDKPAAIFTRFDEKLTDLKFPYPPIYEEKSADYICFTTNPDVHSKYWKVIRTEALDDRTISGYLGRYGRTYEIKTDEIQVSPIFSNKEPGVETVITVPSYYELPGIEIDMFSFKKTYDENGQYIYKKNPEYHGGKYNGRELLLTIAMPVSNQIATIDRCLNSIKPILDRLDSELVIVDTGSTDGTIDVCKKYGARVIDMPWCNNMSAVRNYAINNARGLWYLSMDDDEWFEDVSEIIEFFLSGKYKNYDMASYVQRNYSLSDGSSYANSTVTRIARITSKLHFEGRIHDSMMTVGSEYTREYQFGAYVHHYGFVKDNKDILNKKYIRNTTGLIYDLIDCPENLRYNFQLGRELLSAEMYEQGKNMHIRGVSVGKEVNSPYFAKINAVSIINVLNSMHDSRMLYYNKLIENMHNYTAAERAFFCYCTAHQMAYDRMPEEDIVHELEQYWKYYEEYLKAPMANAGKSFVGLTVCENEEMRMRALITGIASYSRLGKIDEALDSLEKLDIHSIPHIENYYVQQMLGLSAEIYVSAIDKFTDVDMVLWADKLLYWAFVYLKNIDTWNRDKLQYLLSKLSIDGIDKALELIDSNIHSDVIRKFADWVMTLDYTGLSIQELYFYSLMIKNTYMACGDTDEGYFYFKHYAFLYGCYMELIYNPDILCSENIKIIPVTDRATYEVSLALCDGENLRNVVDHLKKAIHYFPGYKKEISRMLQEVKELNRL